MKEVSIKCTECKHKLGNKFCMLPDVIDPIYGQMFLLVSQKPKTCNSFQKYTFLEKVVKWLRFQKFKWEMRNVPKDYSFLDDDEPDSN